MFITITSASDHSQGLTAYYDPYITCQDRPPTHQNGLPARYLQSDYHNNLRLCSAAHGVPRRNVGCFCPYSRGDVICRHTIADPGLWSAVVSWYDYGEEHYDFPEWCRISCECVTEHQAEAENKGDINYYDDEFQFLLDANGVLPNQPYTGYSSFTNTSSSGNNSADFAYHPPSSQNAPTDLLGKDPSGQDTRPSVLNDQCGDSCTTNKDCSSGRNSSCICSTQSEQYQPGTGTVAFLAACITSFSGKRGEGRPCPCNGTYVSYSCCGVEDGLVWEADEFKLGELLGQEQVPK